MASDCSRAEDSVAVSSALNSYFQLGSDSNFFPPYEIQAPMIASLYIYLTQKIFIPISDEQYLSQSLYYRCGSIGKSP